MNKEELNQELQVIARMRQDLKEREDSVREAAIKSIQEVVDALGIKSTEIRFADTAKKHSRPARAPAKYRNPEGRTWTGNGRKPEWVQKVIDEGGDIEAFRIRQ